jgi:protein involved in polysaccharide export with SLBB domain
MRWLVFSALVALAGLSALIGCTQIQTHDSLADLLKDRQGTNAAPPGELSHIIEPDHVLRIEVAPRTPKNVVDEQFAKRRISGTFVVRPSGEVCLGEWGAVSVAGLDTAGAKKEIRSDLTKARGSDSFEGYLDVTVEIEHFDGDRYFVFTNGVDGLQVDAFPMTGTETVQDAVVKMPGVTENMFKLSVMIARKTPPKGSVLLVDWLGVTRGNNTATNYKLQAGDRIYVTVMDKQTENKNGEQKPPASGR